MHLIAFKRLSVQGFRASNDLQDLVGDGRLTGFIVLKFETVAHGSRVVCGFVHGGHPRTVFGRLRIQQRFEHLTLDARRNELFQQGNLIGLIQIVACLALATYGRLDRKQLLLLQQLNSRIFELIVNHHHFVIVALNIALHGYFGYPSCSFKMDLVHDF